jgi:predicted alpha/beta-fold hydrolase
MTSLTAINDESLSFKPLPLLGNPHVQTLLGAILPVWPQRLPCDEREVELDDGDRLLLHDSRPDGWCDGDPIVLIVHGLSGSHASGYMVRTAALLLPHRIRVVRLDLRGAGRGMMLARRSYHAGCSGDIRTVALALHAECPRSPLSLVGFSLGGNIVLKLAGESADKPLPGLTRVAAVAPPVDLLRCSKLIAQPRNRFYEQHFVRELVGQVRERRRYFPHLRSYRFPERMSLRDFDDFYTAPQAGFVGALDYYRRSSSLPYIPRVQVPTLILTARDDPFIAVESFEKLKVPGHIGVRILPQGGHLGFLGRDGAGGIRWAERFVGSWLTQPDQPQKTLIEESE